MKRLKYYTLIGILFVLITGTLSHFVYEWTGNNTFLGLFCPVSESTWEHMKLVFFPMLVYGCFMYYGMKKELTPNKTAGALAAGILTGVLLVPTLFYTYSGILGDNYLFLDIMVFVFSVLAAFRVLCRLLAFYLTEDFPQVTGIHGEHDNKAVSPRCCQYGNESQECLPQATSLQDNAGAAAKRARRLEICSPFLVGAVLLLLACFLIFTYQPPEFGIFAIPDETAMLILRRGH